MPGQWVAISWQGRRARAFVPDPIGTSPPPPLEAATVRDSEQAAAAVRRADDRLPPSWEPMARLLLRAEGVASSFIEGIRAPMAEIALAEIDRAAVSATPAWIADNLAALTTATAQVTQGSLTVAALHRWHRELMASSRLAPTMVGSFRRAQGWIGGTSPVDAVFVPPPPAHVSALVNDLVRFANRDDLDPIAQAALAHAQFETIHPYADGNGRLGRLLVAWILARRLEVRIPPPVSVLIARDPGGYLSGLYFFREGELDRWVSWFASAVRSAGTATLDLIDQMEARLADWRRRLAGLRADAAARRVVELLPAHPVVTSALVAAALGVSERSARSALDVMGRAGILESFEPGLSRRGRPRHWWVARDLVDGLSAWAG